MPTLRSRKPWLALAVVLLLLLAGMGLLVWQQWQEDNRRAQFTAQRELELLASLVQSNLQQGDYQAAARVLENWGRQAEDISTLRLVAGNGFVIAAYRRPAPARQSLALEAPIQYSYHGTARLALVRDLAPIEHRRDTLLLQFATAFLILAGLLAALTHALLLYRRKAAELGARGRELDRANAELNLALKHRQEAEEERDRLISIIEATTDLVGMADPQGNILYVNRAGRGMLGLGDRPASAFRIAQFHPQWATEKILGEGIPAAIRDGAWSGETALLGADGREIPVSQVILSHRDGQGRVQYLSTVMRDVGERKRAETELRHFKGTLDRIQECVFMFDPEHLKFCYVNQGAMNQVGYSESELLNMTPLDIKPEFDEASFRSLIDPLRHGESRTLRFQTVHRHRDGHPVPVEVFLQYVETPGDTPRFVAIVVDISERRSTEAALRASEAQLEEAQAIAHLGSWDLDLATGKANWSREEYRLLGYTPGEVEAGVEAFLARVHPDDLDRVRTEMQAAMTRDSGEYQVEHRVALPDGAERIVLEQGRVRFDDAARPLHMVGTTLDVTETRRAERELEAYRNHLEELVAARTREVREQATIIDQIHDAVVRTDLHGVVTGWNRGAEQLFGYTAQEALGQPVGMVHFDEDFLMEGIIKPLQQKGAHEVEVTMRRKDGTPFDAHLSLSMLYDADGRPSGMIGYSIDISERKRAERLLQQRSDELAAANRELEAFSYSVSHDLRAPLRAIDGFSLALLEDYADRLDAAGRNYLNRVRASAQRMAQLIDDLLNLSRVTRAPLNYAPVDLGAIARELVQTLRETGPERIVQVDIAPNLGAEGDAALLRIMLENLLGNAWKYTGHIRHAHIEFGSYGHDGVTVFFVRDNGAGFDMKYVNKLFGAFQRLHHPSDFEGTGIGLATVQRIIHRHGGRVWAEGKPGEGACFYFTLGRSAAYTG